MDFTSSKEITTDLFKSSSFRRKRLAQARLLALSIMLNEQWNEEQKRIALEEWEKVTFRIYGPLEKTPERKWGNTPD